VIDDIAIVGLDCRFPGALDPTSFWDLLLRSGDGTGTVPPQRWTAADWFDPDGGPGTTNTTRGGFIGDPDAFDHEFFAVSPREAGSMDPQQRLFLQTCWRALEDAGLPPQSLAGTATGVFAGVMANEWGTLHLSDYPRVTAQTGAGNGYCMVPNRVSYHLNLKGPSLAVDTACSSSLVAVHLAVNSLLAGETDYALAGGINLVLTPALGIFYTQAGLSAPDGRCKPFSSQADGIGRSDGVGVVVLRRLADALADEQPVYAVIKGTAVNQDGRSNGLTAPSRWGQQEVLTSALHRAGTAPGDVRFVEAHGTGTVLGDMIESKALGEVYGRGREQPCAIGSIKGNLGHTEAAAGIAGLIKVALSLHHRIVPASPFGTRENPKLALAGNGLRLIKSPLRLPSTPVRAGLSSFGMGGTNAHAVLASAPHQARQPALAAPKESPVVFTLSSNNEAGLRRNLLAQADSLEHRVREPIAGVAWTSNKVKSHLPHRFAVVARSTTELVGRLRSAATEDGALDRLARRPAGRHQVAFLFSGQGTQYPGMTKGLYRDSPSYRRHLDEADEALHPHVGLSVRDLMLEGDERIHQTGYTQPALFAVGYALSRTLTDLGVQPAAVLGHSIGEFAAAVVAEVLSLDDAAWLVGTRGALMQDLPAGGAMVQVRAPESAVAALLADEPLVGVAALNGPDATVLSGEQEALDRVCRVLRRDGVTVTALRVSHAFHSPLMRPMLPEFSRTASTVRPASARIPLYSTVRGGVLEDTPMDGGYWSEHIAAPVRFEEAVRALVSDGPRLLVEIGPRTLLGPMVRRLGLAEDLVHLHPSPTDRSDGEQLAETVAALFRAGLDPHWDELYPAESRVPLRLRPYEFSETRRFWHLPALVISVSDDAPAVRVAPAPVEAQDADGTTAPEDPAATAPAPGGAVRHAVHTAIAEVGGYAMGEIADAARLYEDLGFDSVMVMQLKNRLEIGLPQTREISVQDLLPVLSTVGELIAFLNTQIPALV